MKKNKIKEIRQQRGLTQVKLAEMMGTSKSYISQLENGERDLTQIRTITMTNLCNALSCSANDLFIKSEIEYNADGFLIVDKMYLDSRLANQYVVKIKDDFYLLPYNNYLSSKPGDDLKPLIAPLSPKAEEVPDYVMATHKCVPRDGFKVELLRAITPEELTTLMTKYNLSKDDISGEFADAKGDFFGKSAVVNYTAIQIKLGIADALTLKNNLREQGIEANNIGAGIINIRVK